MAVSEKTVTQSLNIIYNYITSIKKLEKVNRGIYGKWLHNLTH